MDFLELSVLAEETGQGIGGKGNQTSSNTQAGYGGEPNPLMEPTDTLDVQGTDITHFALQDIGWEICGDGLLSVGEECDDDNATIGDGCGPNCKPEICGDGVVNQSSEECDDGNDAANDGCTADCLEELPARAASAGSPARKSGPLR